MVLTRYDPTTYYESADGFSGLEYDLVQLFAAHLQVKTKFIIPDTFAAILQKTLTGKADFAAAGISITEERTQQFLFTPAYHKITEQVIYRSGKKRPKKASDLLNGILEIVKGTSHAETLKQLQIGAPCYLTKFRDSCRRNSFTYAANRRCSSRPASATD